MFMSHLTFARLLGACCLASLIGAPPASATTRCTRMKSPCESRVARRIAPPVTGRVMNESGQPLPNVDVIVTEVGRTTTTAADGTFQLRGLAAGRYHLNFLIIGYSPNHVAFTLPDSGSAVELTVTMRRTTVRLQAV